MTGIEIVQTSVEGIVGKKPLELPHVDDIRALAHHAGEMGLGEINPRTHPNTSWILKEPEDVKRYEEFIIKLGIVKPSFKLTRVMLQENLGRDPDFLIAMLSGKDGLETYDTEGNFGLEVNIYIAIREGQPAEVNVGVDTESYDFNQDDEEINETRFSEMISEYDQIRTIVKANEEVFNIIFWNGLRGILENQLTN